MRDRKRGGLLRKSQRKLPNQNHGRVYENGKRSVLKFAGQIVADPGVRTEQRQVMFAPTPCDIREHRQDRQFVIVVPKNERIVNEQEQAKANDDRSSDERAEKIFSQRTTGFPSVMTSTLSSMPCARADTRSRSRGSSIGS